MKKMILIPAMLLLGVMPAFASAHEHGGVRIGIGIGLPFFGVAFGPPCYDREVYVAPPPVVYQPAPVYVQAPAPVYAAPAPECPPAPQYAPAPAPECSAPPAYYYAAPNYYYQPRGYYYQGYYYAR